MKPVATIASAALIATATLFSSAPASAGNRPTLHPNSTLQHLRNASAATGRAGSASLAVRALLGQDGKTTFDLTTGTLDSTDTAPGNIKKVQLKGFNGEGDLAWSKSYPNLSQGGSVSLVLDHLQRGQPVQTQGNITGINGNRTDVVAVTGNVKLRPDPAVEYLWGPEHAPRGFPINLYALVHEANGDVGATEDCVLFIDGAPVDRANGIYVEGGGYVSCSFTHQFDTAGAHALEVRLTNVVPGDFDTSNNVATRSIDIVTGHTLFWEARASWDIDTRTTTAEGWYRASNGTYSAGSDWKAEWGYSNKTGSFLFWGYAPAAATFPFSQLTLSMAADGAVVASIDEQGVQADWSPALNSNEQYIGAYRYDPATGLRLFIQTSPEKDATWISSELYAGEYTFFSRAHAVIWENNDGTDYLYVQNDHRESTEVDGTVWPANTSATVDFTIVDANGETLSANADMPLTQQESEWSLPPTCQEYADEGYSSRTCYGGEHYETWQLSGGAQSVNGQQL